MPITNLLINANMNVLIDEGIGAIRGVLGGDM